MTLATVELPPGLMLNGTKYSAKNRWYQANRVRWHDGVLRPIGGFAERTLIGGPSIDPAQEIIRDGFSWSLNTNVRAYALGSNRKVYAVVDGENVNDITPIGFVGSDPQPQQNLGYGTQDYGQWFYGAERPAELDGALGIYRWKFDNWGQDLILGPADFLFNGSIYYYDTSTPATRAVAIANAPTDVHNFVVTDQRIVMTIGSNTETRLVRWSDRERFDVWTPELNNYAGSYFIQGSGSLVSINNVLNQVLILSETDAHVARFTGAPLVYRFDRVGDGCGPWNSDVVVTTDRFAIWPGRRGFWMYDGTLKAVPCDVMNFLSKDADINLYSKAFGITIPQYSEVWWFYQSKSAMEVDSYVAFDYLANHWTVGKLPRTAGINGEVYVDPVMVSKEGTVYDHELSDVLIADAYAETGPLEIGQGDRNMAVQYIYPDTRAKGDVNFTLIGSQMPTEPEYSYGPYAYNNPTATRAMGREIRMRVENPSAFWELGPKTRFDIASMGVGRR